MDTAPYFGTTGTGTTTEAENKPKRSHKRGSFPTPALGWVNAQPTEDQFFQRLRVLAKSVIASPGEDLIVLDCTSPNQARSYASHFVRIGNEGLKRGRISAKAKGNQVVAHYDRKAKRPA